MHESKMKVLALQELEQVGGGRKPDAGAADWSTGSVDCGGVHSSEWSTISRGCREDHMQPLS